HHRVELARIGAVRRLAAIVAPIELGPARPSRARRLFLAGSGDGIAIRFRQGTAFLALLAGIAGLALHGGLGLTGLFLAVLAARFVHIVFVAVALAIT